MFVNNYNNYLLCPFHQNSPKDREQFMYHHINQYNNHFVIFDIVPLDECKGLDSSLV